MFKLENTKVTLTFVGVGATEGPIECAAICLKKGLDCDIFKFAKDTKICSYAKVSKAVRRQYYLGKIWNSVCLCECS